MKIRYTRRFVKQYEKIDTKIRKAFANRLKLFIENPQTPILRNHFLKGSLNHYKSINITGDWRALYSQSQEEKQIITTFEMIGTHNQLYK